ncbi:hypothetical protein CAPTEDRAFT_190348 [Capitella teleta]|uniref:Uncharacterized protein n=1 Tax=Capitella teleta TaxID=283909 RepID=R7V4J6_CAPTE|nr:hypothetical protein CAPTEDRAFT_190348 [Capitella teleta]|eukprot:ELU13763.1 hypothetical protein CAPTEDRAFT_190348 [Capitella teleta]
MAKFGCLEQFTQLVRQLHDGMMAHVTDNGEKSDQFPVTNGVKQDCVLAPTLFSLMFSVMMTDAFRHKKPGLDIRYRTDGGLFNLRRLKAKRRLMLAGSVNLFSAACDNFGLMISIKKTEMMHQPAPGQPNQDPCITENVKWSVELMAMSSIDRMNGGVCLEKFIYCRRKAFMVKFVHENDDREYIKVMNRKNHERFKQLGLKILFATVAPNINTIV